MRAKKGFNGYLLCFFLTLITMTGISTFGAEAGMGGVSGSQPRVLPAISESEEMVEDTGVAQALKDGDEVIGYEEVLINTGKPGLGGVSGSQPRVLPAISESEEMVEDTGVAQALKDGYEVVGYVEVLINTGKPGLGGGSGSQPWVFPVVEDKERTNNMK